MNNIPAQYNNFAVQHTNSFMPSMQELEQLGRLCATLAQAPFYQKLGAGGVLAIWLTARELKLPPMMCMNGGLYNIDGKVSMSSQLMNMMIINAGHEIEVLYLTDQGCAIRFTRVNHKTGKRKSDEYAFDMADAKRAKYFGEPGPQGTWLKKPKDNWMMYPRDMFFARALSGGAKKFLPEVMMNCYVFGEIEDAEFEQIESSKDFVANIVPTGEAPKQPESPPKVPETSPEEKQIIDFKERYKIGFDSKEDQYLTSISEKSKKPKEDLIICAVMNEPGFKDAFEKWKAKADKAIELKTEKEQVSVEPSPIENASM